MQRFFDAHRAMLDGALKAVAERTYWSAAPEAPSGKIYGETAKADAEAAFKAHIGKPFEMDHPGGRRLGKEESPWGFPLGGGRFGSSPCGRHHRWRGGWHASVDYAAAIKHRGWWETDHH